MDLKTAVPVWWNWTRRFSYLRDIVWCNPSKITGRARQPILKAISGKKTIKSIYTKNLSLIHIFVQQKEKDLRTLPVNTKKSLN